MDKILEKLRSASQLQIIAGVTAGLAVLGLFGAVLNNYIAPVLWSLSAAACGWFIGFLFGIPKVIQEQRARLGDEDESGTGQKAWYAQRVNTNLEDISDWLTKIIVGVSLVQLGSIPRHFESLVHFISANGVHSPGSVGTILVFFFVLGFIWGYLITRLFLSSAFATADKLANGVESVREFQVNLAEKIGPLGTAGSGIEVPVEGVMPNTAWKQVDEAWRSVKSALEDALIRNGISPHLNVRATVYQANRAGIIDSEQATLLRQASSIVSRLRRREIEVTDSAAEAFAASLNQLVPILRVANVPPPDAPKPEEAH